MLEVTTDLFRNRAFHFMTWIFFMLCVILFLIFNIGYLSQIRMICTHVIIPCHQNSSQRSVRPDSIHHESMNYQWDIFVQILKFPIWSQISSLQNLKNQFSMISPLRVSFVSLIPLDFPLDMFLFSFTPLFILTLGPWLTLSVLVRRLLVCTVTVLQSRWK